MSRRARGRYDILVPLGEGYIRFTSDKMRSLSAEEIVVRLREYLVYIENAIAAEATPKPEGTE